MGADKEVVLCYQAVRAMNLTLKRLESDKNDLENQRRQLIKEKVETERRILKTEGALIYIESRIKLLGK